MYMHAAGLAKNYCMFMSYLSSTVVQSLFPKNGGNIGRISLTGSPSDCGQYSGIVKADARGGDGSKRSTRNIRSLTGASALIYIASGRLLSLGDTPRRNFPIFPT